MPTFRMSQMFPDQVPPDPQEVPGCRARDCEFLSLVASVPVIELIQENPTRGRSYAFQEKGYQSVLVRKDQLLPEKFDKLQNLQLLSLCSRPSVNINKLWPYTVLCHVIVY